MILLFLKLLLAHILGDFIFQSDTLVEKRARNGVYLLLHIGIHAVILMLIFSSQLNEYWPTILALLAAHLLIDSLKVLAELRWTARSFLLFNIDQALHILTICTVVLYHHGVPQVLFDFFQSTHFIIYLTAFLLATFVCPIALRVLFSKWKHEAHISDKNQESLVDAGWIIGVIERLLIIFFIQVGFYEGIGFLLAAKSILRFGDLQNAKNTKFTEYVLVGTFASFMFGTLIGYGLLVGLQYLP